MRELLTVDDAAAPVDLFFRKKKTRHEELIFSPQQQSHPFLPAPPLQEAKFFSEKTNDGARSLIQDSRQNEIAGGRHSSLQCFGKFANRLRGEVGNHHRESLSDRAELRRA